MDNQLLLCLSKTFYIGQKMEFKFVHSLRCKEGAVRVVRFNTDGAYCITGSSDRRLRLWNPHRNVLLKTYSGHGDEVMDASASCDSSQIISCGLDKSIILWDVASGNPIRRFRGHSGGIMTVCFNEESSMAISGSRDNSVKCWDIRSKNLEPVQSLNEAKDAISSVKVSDHEIVTASFDCRIRRYDIRAGEVTSDCLGEAITCVSFTRDGQCTLVSCADGVIRLLDKDTGELLNEFKGHTVDDLCLESSVDYNDGKVLSGSADGKLWAWDLTNQKILAKLSGDEKTKYPTVSLSVHPQENCILATNGSNVFMWNVQTE